MGCLQGLVQSLGHQHQEACHAIQRLCAVDFRLRDDGLGLGSTMGEWREGWCGKAPGALLLLRVRVYTQNRKLLTC